MSDSTDLSYSECKKSDDHYWVKSDELENHCRIKPNR